MAKDRLSSRLVVILHADVTGSTQLVRQDERVAHERIQDAFSRLGKTIGNYNGHVLEIRGDALLGEFERASDAVSAALAFQSNNSEHNKRLSDGIKPLVRVGIALGEVVVADNTATGAGVVMAQRVEQLARPGAVCITGAIHEALPSRMPFEKENLGDHRLKGFDEDLRVFSVTLTPGNKIPDPDTLAQPKEKTPDLPEKTSIAVLPFTNMSSDEEQDYFSDGITEDIITELSRFSNFWILARNSSFVFKNQPIDVKDIAQKLGVDYVIEGSVRKAGDRVRISVQLIEATLGHQIWAERYDKQFRDVFEIQDDVTNRVVSSLASRIEKSGWEHAERKAPENIDAYDLWLRGKQALNQHTLDGMQRAIEWFKKAIELDPKFARGYAGLSFATSLKTIISGWGKAVDDAREQALSLAQQAIAIDDSDHFNHLVLGWCSPRLNVAKWHFDRAMALNPNDTELLLYRSYNLAFLGMFDEAVASIHAAMALDPLFQEGYVSDEFAILASARQYENALKFAERVHYRWPDLHGWLAISNAHLGFIDEAKLAGRQFVGAVHALEPPDSIVEEAECVQWFFREYPFQNKDDIDHFTDGFRKAGLGV
jgi:adenylate cyclase